MTGGCRMLGVTLRLMCEAIQDYVTEPGNISNRSRRTRRRHQYRCGTVHPSVVKLLRQSDCHAATGSFGLGGGDLPFCTKKLVLGLLRTLWAKTDVGNTDTRFRNTQGTPMRSQLDRRRNSARDQFESVLNAPYRTKITPRPPTEMVARSRP